ncbi:MAG: glutamine-hydrolyzing GMP synthase [Porphyromonas sp.]|nr:glutamine-hydrolyzing GMP synthase [Porphyromonas sp.]
MQEKILILDFGSQTTQLIGRRIRDLETYCEIVPYNKLPDSLDGIKGIILSGSPYSVYDPQAFKIDLSSIRGRLPLLGICYGAQSLVHQSGGKVEPAQSREYGRADLHIVDTTDPLLKGLSSNRATWMSHGDTITVLPAGFEPIASTSDVPNAAFRIRGEQTWGVQFHPEAHHAEEGKTLIGNFIDICGIRGNWSPKSFIDHTVEELKKQLGNDKVILALSGGVDSSVCAVLLNRAIGDRLTCIFVDHGLLRKDEAAKVLADYAHLGLNVIGVDASEKFYKALDGVTDPEEKRKIIGKGFIEVFDEEARKLKDIKWLGQGTIYPDVIESVNITGMVIKSHHNVGGLPEKMNLKLVEPLRTLFKDEVRRVGLELGMMPHLIHRHPFPGPGLGIRILGEITREKVRILQEADDIYMSMMRLEGLYEQVWQAGAILLPIRSVGVMGDERTYDYTIALRAVSSVDAMSADWCHLPYDFLGRVSNEIINKVRGVNRCVYDISSKPPSTIEWE